MNGEGEDKGSSGSVDISSRVDPTSVMPPFDDGKAVDSMSVEEAQAEWKEMTLDPQGKYNTFPRSVFLSRRDALWKRGFSEKLAKQKETEQENTQKWLNEQNENLEDRDTREALAEGKRRCDFYFQSEKNADGAIEVAIEVLREVGNGGDLEFLENTGLGNDPRIIEILGNLKDHPELYPAIKKIGLKTLIQIGNVGLKRRKR